MVLAGKINKTLVNLIGHKGGRAIGLSGIDGQMIQARVRDARLGYVGEITKVDVRPILDVIDKGYIPVVSTVGCDTQGHVYNINADTAAARIAGELGAESLIAMTDIGGILRDKDDPSTLIPVIHTADALQLIESGVINGGMLPKVTCCIDAIRWGVHRVFIIDGRVPHAILIEMLTNEGIGTMFVAGQGGKQMNIPQLDNTYIANTYARFPVTIARGKGSLVWDADDKVYIDMATGIAVNSFGIADPAWIRAVTEQLCTVQHASNLYYTAPDAQLAQLLCEKTGMKKVFFSNSGAEANECAIKAARKYAADHKGPEYSTIITLKNSFHGRTITTLAATGQDVFHHDFLPLTEGFAYAEANNLDDLKAQVAAHKCAAIMMEVVQGEGGVIPLTQDFVKGAARLAAEQDLLLICDEVQIGNGRSGKLYGYMHYGITPDIVSTAKGLGGGLPLGATLLGEKVQDVLTPGSHGSTFGGNPVCCAGALSILHRLDGPLLQSVQEKSDFIVSSLTGAKGVKSVTGLGVETERPVKDVINDCMARGVLVISAKNKVRLLPALNIPMAQLEQAVSVLKDVCAGE